MTTSLRTLFSTLSANNFISRGSAGQVFAISKHIAFKGKTEFDNPGEQQQEEMTESAEKIERDTAIHKLLMNHRHPNIVRCVLVIQQGFFLERMSQTLQDRLGDPTSASEQIRWISQIASALAWLEGLGYVHGNLRPANVLLSADGDACLADFDATVRIRGELMAASEPFCKLDRNCEPFAAGPLTEQFALASCIYTVRFGRLPHHDLDAPCRVQKLARNEFPPTDQDKVYGTIVTKSRLGQYETVASVALDIQSVYRSSDQDKSLQTKEDCNLDSLLFECKEF